MNSLNRDKKRKMEYWKIKKLEPTTFFSRWQCKAGFHKRVYCTNTTPFGWVKYCLVCVRCLNEKYL